MEHFSQKNSGFTLIELMVAVSIFSIVMTIAMSALLNIIDLNHKSQAVNTVMNNLSFALEGMGRDIRFGKDYSPADSSLSFKVYDLGTREYSRTITFSKKMSLEDPSLCKDGFQYQIFRTVEDADGHQEGPLAITAPEVCIKNLSFVSNGSGSQPSVLILLNGYAGKGKSLTNFGLQTTVSQRELNVQ